MEINKDNQKKVVKFINKKIKCPSCKKKSNDFFNPFCSQKCSDIDLMKWLSDESYINFDLNGGDQ